MTTENQLTPEQEDYNQRMTKIYKERVENPRLSPGILVEKHAETIPHRFSVFYEEIRWTWDDLNRKSNKISHYLHVK